MSYLYRVSIAIDRLANTILGGSVGETISSRAYRLGRTQPVWYVVNWLLDAAFFWESSHCKASYEWDRDNKDFLQ